MKWIAFVLLAAAESQDPPAMPDNSKAMKKLDWIAGSWVGSGETDELGKYTDDISFDWTLNRNFLKVDQTVRTGEGVLWHSTGLLGWDFKKKQFAWFQFGLDGTIGWTRTTDEGEDGVIVMDGQLTGGGPFSSFRSTFRKTGDGAMHNKVEFKTKDGLTPFVDTEFKKLDRLPERKAVEFKDGGHLKGLEWMVGTWVGEGEMPGFGKYEDEYRLEWIHGRNFIKNDYWMRAGGKVVWHDTGMIGYDVDRKKFVGVNFGIDGTIGWGEGGETEPATFTWEGETVGPTENIRFRATLRKIDGDTLSLKIEKKNGDAWVEYAPEQMRKRKK